MKKKLWRAGLAILVLVASCTATPPARRKLPGASRPPAHDAGGGALFRWPSFSAPARPGLTRASPPRVSHTLPRAARRLPPPGARRSKRERFQREREKYRQMKEHWKKREVWE